MWSLPGCRVFFLMTGILVMLSDMYTLSGTVVDGGRREVERWNVDENYCVGGSVTVGSPW